MLFLRDHAMSAKQLACDVIVAKASLPVGRNHAMSADKLARDENLVESSMPLAKRSCHVSKEIDT